MERAGIGAGSAHQRRRLLVVSNRAPVEWRRVPGGGVRVLRTVGGLASALNDALRAYGGTWIAWSGATEADGPELADLGLGYRLRAVRLKEREISHYYSGFSNQVLWPLCHSFPGRCRLEASYWAAYRQANEKFAAAVLAEAEGGDLVWMHDFHLCLAPAMVRAARPDLPLGVFWHIPFPPVTIFGILPWRDELLTGMLGADVVGFQTENDACHFLESVHQLLDLPVAEDPPRVLLGDREVRVAAFPIGIDTESFVALAADPAVQERSRRLRAQLQTEWMILGVDRLDYTKGIPERLHGFERFLESHPEMRRRVCLVQLTVPSRVRLEDYREMKHEIDAAVGRIAGRFTYEGHTPIRYLYTALPREQLVSYYVAADVALVTPLRDGMNLVGKEYVACRTGGDGVLVLSEFAGAAQELRDALLVNPYDVEAINRRLAESLTMPAAERRRRMRLLRERVFRNNLAWWSRAFLELLGAVAQARAPAGA